MAAAIDLKTKKSFQELEDGQLGSNKDFTSFHTLVSNEKFRF